MVAPCSGCASLPGLAACTLALRSAPKLASHFVQMSYHRSRMVSVHFGSVIQLTTCFVKRPSLNIPHNLHHTCCMLLPFSPSQK